MKRAVVALIDEARCIGCTQCLRACPVDAIVGADQLMHTVIEAYCTGCELCLPPCPVDCISLVPAPGPWTKADAEAARRRGAARTARTRREDARPAPTGNEARANRRSAVAAALERARARRASRSGAKS